MGAELCKACLSTLRKNVVILKYLGDDIATRLFCIIGNFLISAKTTYVLLRFKYKIVAGFGRMVYTFVMASKALTHILFFRTNY